MSDAVPNGFRRRTERLVLVAFLDGRAIANIYQGAAGVLRLVYNDEWRRDTQAYPLSLSVPLTGAVHKGEVVTAFLWGLLPDNERTLEQYGRVFGVSPRNPVALLAQIGADCAGAVQFAAPENAEALARSTLGKSQVEWLSDSDVAQELRTVREQGIPGRDARTAGQFSLAGAQPKIALLEQDGKWGRPYSRTATNRILKPPVASLHGFAENEHICLELARSLGIGAVTSRVTRFKDETAIVVERYDRIKQGRLIRRIHQEDFCQALGVMPTRKNENEGGPGIAPVLSLLRATSLKPQDDIDRFLRATALNWVLAATDAHAKNFALLHGPGGDVRLAPFYDIVSFLPYADPQLHRVKLAMKIGGEYLVRRIGRAAWESLARENGLRLAYVMEIVADVLKRIGQVADSIAQEAIDDGLAKAIVARLIARIRERSEVLAAF